MYIVNLGSSLGEGVTDRRRLIAFDGGFERLLVFVARYLVVMPVSELLGLSDVLQKAL